MDFEKTSFSVDWFTPGDKYGPKRLSFPKSACISIDDLVHVSDTPLSLCFTPVDEVFPRPHAVLDASPDQSARGWTNSAPASPTARASVSMCAQEPHAYDDWRALASPGLVDIADDCASCGVDLDVSCLRALDEQLILSPVDCFTELCWAAAVQDDMTARFVRKKKKHARARGRARSCRPDGGRQRAHSPSPSPARAYPGSFEVERSRPRPLAATIALSFDTSPQRSPTSPFSVASHDTSRTYPEKEPRAYILYADPEGHHAHAHARDVPARPAKKRDWTLLPAPLRLPPMPAVLKTSPPSPTFRVVSDVPLRKRSPLVVTP